MNLTVPEGRKMHQPRQLVAGWAELGVQQLGAYPAVQCRLPEIDHDCAVRLPGLKQLVKAKCNGAKTVAIGRSTIELFTRRLDDDHPEEGGVS